jgi:hypothetical protein
MNIRSESLEEEPISPSEWPSSPPTASSAASPAASPAAPHTPRTPRRRIRPECFGTVSFSSIISLAVPFTSRHFGVNTSDPIKSL